MDGRVCVMGSIVWEVIIVQRVQQVTEASTDDTWFETPRRQDEVVVVVAVDELKFWRGKSAHQISSGPKITYQIGHRKGSIFFPVFLTFPPSMTSVPGTNKGQEFI